MIIIGSYAAKLIGELPPWRSGRIGDIDLIGSHEEYEQVLGSPEIQTKPFVTVTMPRSAEKFGISRLGLNLSIEFDARDLESTKLLHSLPDNSNTTIFGVPALVPSLTTQWAIKSACVHLPIQQEKHRADVEWFALRMRQMGIVPQPVHLGFLEVYRSEKDAYFAIEP